MSMSPLLTCLLFVTGHALRIASTGAQGWSLSFWQMFYTQQHYRFFKNGPCDLWCSYHLLSHRCCKVSGSGPELFYLPWLLGGLLLDLNHLVGFYHNNTRGGTKCMMICLDLPRISGLHAKWCSLSLHCSNITQLSIFLNFCTEQHLLSMDIHSTSYLVTWVFDYYYSSIIPSLWDL